MPCAPDMQGLNHRTTREVPWYPLKYRVSFPPCPQTPFPYLLPPDTGPLASQLNPSIHFSTYSSLSQYSTFTHLKYSPLLQLLFSHSVVCHSLRPHGLQHARPPCPSPTPRVMPIESVMPSNHLILYRPLLLLPSSFPSIRVFSKESALCIRWPEYWSFSFSISPSNEYSGLISFRMDWLDLLAVQGTLKSLLQHQSSKASNSLALSLLYGATLTSVHDR